ncbi:S1 RNA-binding domain-containing protein [Mesorhizobium sp. M0048]|uniref:S1 RNA-binding domain-containing protein n=1 Tax=Mesorhizobium sp. M0048 TaxID=2956860 RepID=UPI003336EE9F
MKDLRSIVERFGVDADIFDRELEYLVKGFCVICEDFRQSNITDSDLVSIAPAGHVHLEVCMDQYYLAAIAEDNWFTSEARAQGIAQRITDTRRHYTNATILDNAEDVLDELEMLQAREVAAYRAMFNNDELADLISLSKARSRLSRFESEVVGGPWVGANKRHPVGTVSRCKVSGSAAFGVFVELERDFNGLIHSSRLPQNFASDPRLKRGEEIEVRVLNVDRVERRVELEWIR